jgi:uncharacterized membrane protein YgcG
MLITAEGQAGPAAFVDSHAKALVTIDHRAGAATSVDADADVSPHFDASVEPQRAAVAAVVRGYVGAAYNAMGAGTAPAAKGAETFSRAGVLAITTSVLVKNLANYWSGAWRGRYTVDLTTPGKAVLAGGVRIVTHYFENGNTQMHNDKAMAAVTLTYGSPEELARGVVRALAGGEDGLVEALDEMYESMSSAALKEMRRVLPVSGVKMNWNVAEHRMRRALQTNPVGGAAGLAAAAAGHARGPSFGAGSPVKLPGVGGGGGAGGFASPGARSTGGSSAGGGGGPASGQP